jgi:hypothetical protein
MRRLLLAACSCLLMVAAGACSSTEEPKEEQPVVDAGPDPKIAECNEVAYRQVQGVCYGGFLADVDPNSRCGSLQGGPAAFEAGNYGETACVAREGGLILKCVFDQMSTCEGKSPSVAAEIWSKCLKQVEPTYKAPEESCRNGCFNTRFECEKACAAEAAKACFDCYSQCGLADQRCNDACPRAK